MTDRCAPDPFAGLFPAAIESMRVAWHHLRVPRPPDGYVLDQDGIAHPEARRWFARRASQILWTVEVGAAERLWT